MNRLVAQATHIFNSVFADANKFDDLDPGVKHRDDRSVTRDRPPFAKAAGDKPPRHNHPRKLHFRGARYRATHPQRGTLFRNLERTNAHRTRVERNMITRRIGRMNAHRTTPGPAQTKFAWVDSGGGGCRAPRDGGWGW